MRNHLILQLEGKGLSIPKKDHQLLVERWASLQKSKPTFEQLNLDVQDIAAKNVPGDDHYHD